MTYESWFGLPPPFYPSTYLSVLLFFSCLSIVLMFSVSLTHYLYCHLDIKIRWTLLKHLDWLTHPDITFSMAHLFFQILICAPGRSFAAPIQAFENWDSSVYSFNMRILSTSSGISLWWKAACSHLFSPVYKSYHCQLHSLNHFQTFEIFVFELVTSVLQLCFWQMIELLLGFPEC